MFHARLKAFIAVWVVVLMVLVARLVGLQVVHAEYYTQRAREVLLLPPKALPFVRGRIVDRTGQLLVSEEPSWDVRVDYGLLAMDEDYISGLVKQCRKSGRYGHRLSAKEVREALLHDLERMWSDLARFSGLTVEEIRDRVEQICTRVQRVRKAVKRRRQFDAAVREERMRHPVLSGLDDQEQLRARVELVGAYPWLHVEDSTRRVYHDVMPIAHILGRVGSVDAEDIRDDPESDDLLGKYLPNEIAGKSGTEAAAERLLRGRRGRIRMNLAGQVLENVEAENGSDVVLTVRCDLQGRLYEAFAEYLLDPQLADSPGGVIVVLDIPAREVLALVSYPSYDPNGFDDDYEELRADTLGTPLRFRALANQYAPGSIVKPLAALAGLSSGRITLDTRYNCTGYMFPNLRDQWRCWKITGSSARKAHGSVNVVEAIEGSCNVFMYHVGEEVGTAYLTNFFDMFGFGRSTGIGLPEEVFGLNPTPDWLAQRNRLTRGTPRFLAIGQAELTVTPVQAANMFAQYASGVYKPVTLIRGLRDETPEWRLPGEPSHWQAIREGLFRVVNSDDGTAWHYARYEGPGYRICGKTGSASTPPRPLSYSVRYVDKNGNEAETIVPGGSRSEAADDFRRLHPEATFDLKDVIKHEWWPPDEDAEYAHAWFGGYLQAVDEAGAPLWDRKPRIAFVVLVEYGGSGGHTAAPFAKDRLVPILFDTLGPDLDPDGHAATQTGVSSSDSPEVTE